MKKLGIKVLANQGFGIIHDSRRDVNALAKALNAALIKIDELVDEVNDLKEKLGDKNV